MKLKSIIFILLVIFSNNFYFSQSTVLISQGGTVAVSNGDLFYDAGGSAGNDGTVNYTITLTPSVAGESICIDFTSFKSNGSLNIYDGTSTAATNIGTLKGDYGIDYNANGSTPYGTGQINVAGVPNVASPGIFCANNASGALTLVFTKSGTQSVGWAGTIISYIKANVGCNINLSTSPSSVCAGSTTTLLATGTIGSPLLSNDFNTGVVGNGWASTASVTFTNVLACEPNNGHATASIDNSTFIWMQSAAAPRSLETNAFNVSNGGYLSFDFRAAADDNGGNGCEANDNEEGVYVQYSIDNGTTWVNMKLMFPGPESSLGASASIGCGMYIYDWNKTTIPLPAAALTTNTKFRWFQVRSTTASQDSWGLDNVAITSIKTSTITIKNVTNNVVLATGTTSTLSATHSPTVTTVYESSITDGTTTCTSQKTVTVNSCAVTTPSCGSCSTPNCPIAGPYTNYTNANSPANQCSQQQFLTPNITGAATYTTYHTVTTSASSGTLGAIVSIGVGSPCSVTRSAKLYPLGGGCAAGAISPNSTTANGSSFYNPEWYGLSLSTSYVLEIVYTVPAGCIFQDYCASYYTPTVAVTPSSNCGACATPTCPIGSVATYTNRTYSICQTGLSITNTTYTEYHTVTADAFGNVGIAQQFQLAAGVNSGVTRSAYLLPLGNCGASQINPTLANGNGVGSGFNPEWYGLTPGAQYVVVITITVASGTTVDQLCTDYYGIPVTCPTVGFAWNPTTPTAGNLSCSNNTNYRLKANTTGSTGNEGQYIAPGFTINDGGAITFSSIDVEEGAGTGFVNIGTIINLSYCVPTYQYRIRLFGTGTGTVSIIDHATGNVLYSGPFTNGMIITLAPGTILGTAVFSGNGVSNIKPSNPVTYIGSGYGYFNPSVAGAGTHTITYTWNNGQGCSGTSSIVVTVSGTTVSVTNASICASTPTVLTASGATTYSWSTGATTSTISVSPSSNTNYTVTGTTGGCISTKVASVTVNSSPTVAVTNTTICSGANANLTASGAATYSWNTGATSSTISVNPTSTTIYTVTGTTSGCTNTKTVSVTTNSSPTVAVTNTAVCSGGTANLTASGATTYSWNTGATTLTISVNPTSTTIYTVTGTTSGCTNTKTVSVSINATPTVAVTNTTICSGANANLTASGATTYSWNTGATTSTISVNPTSTTIYTVTGTTSGCTNTKTVSVTINATPTIAIASQTICPGGSATLTASGATSYTWLPSSSTNTNLVVSPASTSTYTLIGSNGTCTSSATGSVTVGAALSITPVSASVCVGGSVTLSASGALNYTWSPSSNLNSANGSSVVSTPTASTTYTVIGANGACTGSATVNVTITGSPTISVNSASICAGGVATLTATGATSYTWSGSNLSATSGSNVTANPSSTSNYTITGSNGCVSSKIATVTLISSPNITVTSATICPGAIATLTASGGTSYTWSPIATLSSNSGSVVIASPTVNTSYSIIGSNGTCTSSATSSVTISGALAITPVAATVCAGGSATLTASGASSYTWSPSFDLNSANGATVVATPTTSTTYTILGSTGACTGSTTVNVDVNAVSVISINSATICQGSSVVLTASGATSYSWTGSGGLSSTSGTTVSANPTTTKIYTVTGLNGCSGSNTVTVTVIPNPTLTVNSDVICSSGSTTLTANGASSYTWTPSASLNTSNGAVVIATPATSTNYTVIGTNNTCTSSVISTVTVNSALTITPNAPVVCSGQSATLTATGASSYTWSPATDLNTVNGATVIASPSVSTTYTILAESGVCTGSTTVNVTVNPTATISVTDATICAGTSSVISASGATTYSWSGASGLSSTNGTSVTVNPSATTVYTVTGLNGCSSSTTTTVTVIPNPVITVNTSTMCFGESTALTATGADTYSWFPSTSLSSGTGSVVTASPNVNTSYIIYGTVGTCSSSATSNVFVTKVVVTATSANICPNSTGVLTANGASTYTWSPSASLNTSVASSVIASPTVNTIYSITGQIGACTGSTTVLVTLKSLPSVSVNSGTLCSGQSSVLTVSGATTYSWSNGSTTSTISVAPNVSETYTVTGVLAGCSNTATSTISVTTTPTLVTGGDITIIKGTTGTITATGGVTYTWTPSNYLSCSNCSSPIASPSVNTEYCVKTNNGACIDEKCVNVTVEIYCDNNNDFGTPNAFTPNNDGVNDFFCLQGWNDCISSFKIAIFDRWGEKVYESSDPNFCWDGTYQGKPLNSAVFVFYINAQALKIGAVSKKGNITLVR
jgi:gliding motility-associated-like protein